MGKSDLDWDAVADADDRFYAAHPEMIDEDGNRIPLSRNDPKQAAMRDDWWRFYHEEKAKNDAPPKDPPDDEDPVDPCKNCDDNKPDNDCQPIAAVTLERLTFENDHGKLKDETVDWTDTGSLYAHPDWTTQPKENPVSITMDEEQAVTIAYTVGNPDACPEKGAIQWDGGPIAQGKETTVTFSPTAAPVERKIPKLFKAPLKIMRDVGFINWRAEADSSLGMGSSKNTIFVTWGPTLDAADPDPNLNRENGATFKRMDTAVEWAEPANSIDEIKVVEYIFTQFDRYVLGLHTLSKAEQDYLLNNRSELDKLKKAGWPTYFKTGIGAWPMHDHQAWGAECQAICRFCRAIMRQLGARSTLEFRTYTADFADPETVLHRATPSGPTSGRAYALADAKVEIGRTYWDPLPGEEAEVGWNNFEAYLKVTPDGGGKVRLFGGGVGLLESDRNPLHVFYGLAELQRVRRALHPPLRGKTTQSGWKVTDLHVYQDKGGWSGPLP
jgi:hypothetical protein